VGKIIDFVGARKAPCVRSLGVPREGVLKEKFDAPHKAFTSTNALLAVVSRMSKLGSHLFETHPTTSLVTASLGSLGDLSSRSQDWLNTCLVIRENARTLAG